MLKRLVAGVRRRLRPRREGPVYFWWEGTCYRTRADGAVVRRQGLPIRLPDRRLLRLGDWYPIDVAIPGHVAGVDEEPARWHDADIAWRESPAGPTGSGGALALVVLGFNAAAQFAAWLNRTAAVHPELLRWSPRLLFDNSTACDPTYDALCARFGFEHGRYRNVGIAGARLEAARWALQAGLGGMLFFEDDFLFHAEPGRCRNGFQHTVPGLVGALPAIAEREGLDFLKLSFSEAMADHHVNVGWYAATDAERARDFPRATTPRLVRTGAVNGCAYLVGDIFYGHWPTLITRRGLEMLFFAHPPAALTEQAFVRKSQELLARGLIRSGVLLASPIEHRRVAGYAPDERRE